MAGGQSTDGVELAHERAPSAAEAEAEAAVARAQTIREEFAHAQRAEEMSEAGHSLSAVATGGLQGGVNLIAAVRQAVEQTRQRAMGGHGVISGTRVPGGGYDSPSSGTSPRSLHSGAASLAPAGERGAFRSAANWTGNSADGSALVAAAQTQAFAATTAIDQKMGVPNVTRNRLANHPSMQVARRKRPMSRRTM